ncbi:CHAT domain-containing protein [Maribacter luteus]|uniref:CHAT domain-containing protein n=1 Tax=Maribacter luteus TaxID=2594478 RepID=A0A6I2MH14_9FLAO|nr:CHAT domain-containing protein [Maribacter luteus]MRX62542.1 CHAT domain-containing protein [Maribacter luteus]
MKKALIFTVLLCGLFSSAQDEKQSTEIVALNKKATTFFYTQKDSAYVYFNKVYDIAKKNNDSKNLIQTLFSLTGVANYHRDMKTMGANLEKLDSLLVTEKKGHTNFSSTDDYNIYLYFRGAYHFQLSEDSDARKAFEEIILNVNNTADSLQSKTLQSLTSVAHSFLGKIYLSERKFELAKQLYNKNIREILASEDVDQEALYGNFNLLAEVLMNEKKYDEASTYWIKTLKYNQQKNNSNAVIANSFYVAQNFNQLNQRDSALYYLEYAKSVLNDNPVFYPKYHILKSDIFAKNEEYDASLTELEKAVNKIQNTTGNTKALFLASTYIEMGKINDLNGNPEKALSNFRYAEKQFKKVGNRSINELKLLKNKAHTLNGIHEPKYFLASLETVDEAIHLLNDLKPTFKSQQDKLLLIEDAFPIFESGLEAIYMLHASKADDSLLDKAFYFMEKSKSVLLMEALLNTKATKFANIPDNLLRKESQLKSEITFIEKQLNTSKTGNFELEGELFALKNDHLNLIHKIESGYPSYYNLKYRTKVISLEKTQALLDTDELMISFFFGNNDIYAISLDNNSKKITRIPIDSEFETKIKMAYRMFSNPKSDIVVLGKATHNLYKHLLDPILKSDHHKKLIITTDGLLNYIPFAALNTNPEGLTYLAENHAVSYVNSATMLAELRQRQPKEHTILAFAPSFDGTVNITNTDRGKLLPLPNNKKEVEQILTSFNGSSYIDEDASLLNFKSQLSSFGIVHLATHAIFDDAAPEYSYLAFSQKGNKTENLLYVADLYNLQIDADLVTLSACESGLGDLKRGEGFMSLARGFFYSGAASIASTLWKINDASSATLMSGFYKNLSRGDAKDLALQRAQIEFLNTNRDNGLSHPYYWSGFVISGSTVPLATSYNWVYIIIGTIILLTGGFYYFIARKKRRA